MGSFFLRMRSRIIQILARQIWDSKFKSSVTLWLMAICNLLLFIALISGHLNVIRQQDTVATYSHDVRERWENRPDKHPHRMAHYGYVAFRSPFPLSFFDFGVDSFVGKAVFLEAHKQNTVNFSEASFSNGLLRFGEINAGMILQLLLPLFIFFLGYDLVAKERESGTLRIVLAQGLRWEEIIFGKSIGLFYITLTLVIPSFVLGFLLLMINDVSLDNKQVFLRFILLSISYLTYFFIICILSVLISAISVNSKTSLIRLIGLWLLFTLVTPKISQVIGYTLYPSPSKVEFESRIEAELIKQGDSHNPNDGHFKKLKDSILKVYNVDSTHKLPFNYSGFVMREGEKLSANTFMHHQKKLVADFKKQQRVVSNSAIINPYIAIKTISMSLSGTDYDAFDHFQNQTEKFRYNLAQNMNELQMKFISNKVKNSSDKNARISKENWAQMPDFHHLFPSLPEVLKNSFHSIISLLIWFIGLITAIKLFSHRIKSC